MTKTQAISLKVLELVAQGVRPVEALKIVCGADKVDAMISELYEELRGQ
jgi:hypothetical protein